MILWGLGNQRTCVFYIHIDYLSGDSYSVNSGDKFGSTADDEYTAPVGDDYNVAAVGDNYSVGAGTGF